MDDQGNQQVPTGVAAPVAANREKKEVKPKTPTQQANQAMSCDHDLYFFYFMKMS